MNNYKEFCGLRVSWRSPRFARDYGIVYGKTFLNGFTVTEA